MNCLLLLVRFDHCLSINQGKWHHRRDFRSGVVTVYVDGVEQASASRSLNQTTDLSLVRINQFKDFFDGDIDDVAVFQRVLTVRSGDSSWSR